MCTGIKITAQDNAVVYGRTMEFGQETESNIVFIPRNHKWSGTTPDGKQGLSWLSRYAAVGANMLNVMHIVDGVNETGLVGGLFYFPNYAKYQAYASSKHSCSIAPWELLTFLLTTCSSIAEVQAILPTIFVVPTIFGPWHTTPPLHAILHDKSGASLVIEYINGTLIMHDNPLGVFTNAPDFPWHLTNLNNYINLSPQNAPDHELDGVFLRGFGQGSGLLGLPGDFTPPSRFVRAALFTQSMPTAENRAEAIKQTFHILNLFNIPVGIVADATAQKTHYDYTQWTTAADLADATYYWNTYENSSIHCCTLTKEIAEQLKEPLIIPMHYPSHYINNTPKLNL